jgi:GDP/UDP-N,N'-diacetylbacillosamine 2-epimerase (hydrolysing)
MKRKICVVTGSRAEYGLLRWVMHEINDHPDLVLQIIATGGHLSEKQGLTFKEIERDGFQITSFVENLSGPDTEESISKAIGNGIIGFADAFNELSPDLVLILGDRFEILAAAVSAMVARIPIAHIHGGELTEGSMDDAIRHSITKMSHVHFVANSDYAKRVIQLGESPDKVYNVGGLGIENIFRMKNYSKTELEGTLEYIFQERNLVVTFHPATLDGDAWEEQLFELFLALDQFPEIGLIFTLPNADVGSDGVTRTINEFVSRRPNAKSFVSLGSDRYLSCIMHSDGVLGNSSSGICEVPSLKKATINIGNRQRGRTMSESIISCDPTSVQISESIMKLYSKDFQNKVKNAVNPYGMPGACKKIVDVVSGVSLDSLIVKTFHDLAGSQK